MDQSDADIPSRSISTTLLQRAKDFDNAAWERLVEVFSPFVYRWFRRWGITSDDAPDLVQGVFVRVSTGIKRFRRDKQESTFRGWLWRIARNEANDYFKANRPDQLDDSFLAAIPDGGEGDDTPDDAAVLLHRILEMIRGDFNETTYQIFWRCELEGHDTQQVASDYGMKNSAVREAKRRVKSRLRQECLELLGHGYWPFDPGE